VSFHVELRRSFHRAWLFNLDAAELRRRVLGPWVRGDQVEVGDRDWSRADSRLTVLEGRSLEPAELAHGQGWNAATKVGREVTADLLAGAAGPDMAPGGSTIALLADERAAGEAMADLLSDLGLTTVAWELAEARLLAGSAEGIGAAAVVIVLSGAPGPDTALSVGMALGALRQRAILVTAGEVQLPARLTQLGHVRMEAERGPWAHALAERLRAAGCRFSGADGGQGSGTP
jgi:hypothetical protein